jgi:excinuclease ABC subunit C
MSRKSHRIEKLKEYVKLLPASPGVYQYYNGEGVVIYVGKAKNLKKRVSSYFTKRHDNLKTSILVRNIADIKHIIVDTEEDALLLENNLIKKYQPRYNVLLKDDKSYPWICVKKEPFPRVFSTRNIVRDGSDYFGPYTSVHMVRTILEVIKRLYKLRNCNFNLSRENIKKGKLKVCLEYHIGNCMGPCENLQSEEDYQSSIQQIKNILKGNLSTVTYHLKDLMKKHAAEYNFEKAEEIKVKLEILENYRSKSTVVSSSIANLDVFAYDEDENYGYVNFLKVVNGAIVQAHTIEMKKKLQETKEELLTLGMIEIRQKIFSNSKEIIIPYNINIELKNVKLTVPQRGDKYKLLELSKRNVKYYKLEKLKQQASRTKKSNSERIMETMKNDLRLKELPAHIECFDNSNIQGHYPVASCVVFRNGQPYKKDYRHFNIKTVVGPDDFASMEEVLARRYKRLLEEEKPLPQLIVIDGGKGQLGAAVKSLEKLGLRGKISIIGIAKKLEEIYFPGDSIPIYLDKNSESLKVIKHLRDEAHRFGITFHRNKRSKDFIKSELDTIAGIGPKTRETLLKKFKSVKRIKEIPFIELSSEIGESKAKKIIDGLSGNKAID